MRQKCVGNALTILKFVKEAHSPIRPTQDVRRKRTSRSSSSKALDFSSEKKPCRVCKMSFCGPCYVCKETKDLKYYHFKNAKKDSDLYRNLKAKFPMITDIDAYCDTCRCKYKKSLYVISTKPASRKKDRPMCFLNKFKNCECISNTETPSVSVDTVNCAFDLDLDSVPSKIDLCTKHYQILKILKTTQYCCVCKCVMGNVRYCCKEDHLESVNEMAAVINDNVILSAGDIICRSCYGYLYVTSNKCSNLESLCLKLNKLNMQTKDNDVQENIIVTICIILCDLLKNDVVILLVDLYEKYVEIFHKKNSSADTMNLYSREKILSEILSHFDNLLEVHKTLSTKQGRMLVYRKCDFKAALHKILYKLHVLQKKVEGGCESDFSSTDEDTLIVSPESEKANLYCASIDVNNRLVAQAEKIRNHFVSNPLDLKSLDFENLMTFIDPRVWNSIFFMTSNEREKKDIAKDFDMDVHIKLPMNVEDNDGDENRFLRRMFGLFNLQFILNDNYNYPIHVMNADVIKRLSNSSKLLHILNRVGFCVSDDTLDRFLEIVACEREKNPIKNLDLNAFTVVSIDNIDCLSPYAIMSSNGTKERSWHGTSVMAQQPQPHKDFLFPLEKISSFQRFSLLKVYGDGRCFYRCLAAYSTLSLRQCPRNAYGVPISEGNLNSVEVMIADKIQLGIRTVLQNNIASLDNLPFDIRQSCLEKQSGVFYDDFTDCVNDHSKLGTYACTLQIVTAAYAMKTQIHIYKLTHEGYDLMAVYPPDFYEESDPVHILHTPDSYGNPGHFDLLTDIDNELPTDVEEMISVEANVCDVFSQWQRVNSEYNTDCDVSLDEIVHLCFGGIPAKDPRKSKRPKKGRTRLRKKRVKNVRKKTGKEPFFKTFIPNQIQLHLFKPSCSEELATSGLLMRMFMYTLERYTIIKKNLSINLPTLKCKLAAEDETCTVPRGKAKFAFIEIYNDKADCTSTIKKVLNNLHHTFKVSKHVNHLFIVGDLKTYEFVMKAKSDQGKAMDWVIPYVGDWHVLKNLQSVIMKIFWDAGLKEVAKVVHKGGSVLNLRNCSSFKHTHRFILQAYEALYLYQIDCFLRLRDQSEDNSQISHEEILYLLAGVVKELEDANAEFTNIDSFLKKQEAATRKLMPKLWDEYLAWCMKMSEMYETFAFWNRFLKSDVFAYVQLFISIRTGKWDLRQAAIKHIATLFHAFDHQNYARWLPIHLGQIYAMPEYVLLHLKSGSFVSSIKGINYSCVGFDEAHEMLINKMVKNVIIRNTPRNIARIASTLEFQAELVDNYVNQAAKAKSSLRQRDFAVSVIQVEHENIRKYFEKWVETTIFHKTVSSQLYHAFSNKEAEPGVSSDLKRYSEIGYQSFLDFIRTRIVGDSSVKRAPLRKKRLKTFAKRKIGSRCFTSLQKEKKLIAKCLKRTIQALKAGKQLPHPSQPQILETPRSICLPDGSPRKGKKSTVYSIFQTKYSESPVTSESIEFKRNDTCLVAEGMNMIYIPPSEITTFETYATYLSKRIILPYIKNGYSDIRVLFDQFETQGKSPKVFEQKRRDGSEDNTDMLYDAITDNTIVPTQWNSFLKVRENKYMLCTYLAGKLPYIVQPFLKENHKFITSGGFHRALGIAEPVAMCATNDKIFPFEFQTNHEESDTQIWLHVKDTKCSHVHVRSIDRDIGMIGIVQFHEFPHKQLYIEYQQNPCMYVNINELVKCLGNDPDLCGPIQNLSDICKVIQTAYICSGSDFTSYFYGQPKSKFYEVLFQFSNFITSTRNDNRNVHGCLTQTAASDLNEGLLSFYRLIGCIYFKANRACLSSYETPEQLFNSFGKPNVSSKEQHLLYLSEIRKASSKCTFEDELMPSDAALEYHWQRCCWVSAVWQSSQQWVFMYPQITDYGWTDDTNGVQVKWDSPENVDQIKENVLYLTRGCGCKKSMCKNNVCKCRKNGTTCGPGCTCVGCENCVSVADVDNCSEYSDSDSEKSDNSENEDDADIGGNLLISSDVENSDDADEDGLA